MNNKKLITILYMFFFLFYFLSAQEENDTKEEKTPVRKVCVFDIQQIPPDSHTPEGDVFTEVIKNTLVFELKLAGFELLEDEIWKETRDIYNYSDEDILEGAQAIEVAKASKADVAINGFLTIEKKRILFGLKCYDVRSKRLAVSILKNGRAGVSATSLITRSIEEIIPQISKELNDYTSSGGTIEQEVVVYEDITFKEMIELGTKLTVILQSPDEEAEIYLAETPLGKIKNGQLSFDSKAFSSVYITIKKPGYHDRSVTFELKEEDHTFTLPALIKKTRWALKTTYSLFQTLGLGVGARYYINPDWFFISTTLYPYVQYGRVEDSNSVLHIDLNFSVGHYIYFPSSNSFRAGVFIGAGTIDTILLGVDEPMIFDFYWDIFGTWVEWKIKNLIFYCKEWGRYNHNITGKGYLETGWNKPTPVLLAIGVIWKW